jgi:hypothetical protein
VPTPGKTTSWDSSTTFERSETRAYWRIQTLGSVVRKAVPPARLRAAIIEAVLAVPVSTTAIDDLQGLSVSLKGSRLWH